MNKIILAEHEVCSGCGACSVICEREAIAMCPDEEGFLRPVIDDSKCVNCGLCSRVCPVLTSDEPSGNCTVYAARAQDDQIRMVSTSGGIFSLFAKHVFKDGGVVYGVAFNSQTGEIEFVRADDECGLAALRGSKYVQADAGKVLRDVKKILLETNKTVLFSGTPCQIAGLDRFLKLSSIERSRVYLVEVVCHAVSSPLAWRRFLDQFSCKITKVTFRSKKRGWHKYVMSLVDVNGRELLSHIRGYTFLWGFLQSLYNRPSCHRCKFRCGRSCADATIGDFWKIDCIHSEIDDDKGVSLVVLRTASGRRLWDAVEKFAVFRQCSLDMAINGNPALVCSPPTCEARATFFARIKTGERFDAIVKDLLGMSFCERLWRYVSSSIGKVLIFVRLIRVEHWVRNVLVLLPPFFFGVMFCREMLASMVGMMQ